VNRLAQNRWAGCILVEPDPSGASRGPDCRVAGARGFEGFFCKMHNLPSTGAAGGLALNISTR